MTYKLTIKFLAFFLLMLCNNASAQMQIIDLHLARPSFDNYPKNQYIKDLLSQSFAKVGKKVNFVYSVTPMNNKRVVEELAKEGSIDLTWLPIKPKSHPTLLHTSMPIYKGLHGKRLLIINKNQQQKFSYINSLNDLKPLIALQRQSWTDFAVLKKNGLTINGELDYKGMIKAIDSGLADYFPRSVLAIEAEIAKQQHLNLMIEPRIMLQYPSSYFFYVHESNKELISLLETGLSEMQKTGEFNALYLKFFGETEKRLKLSSKKVFHLH